MIIFLNENFWAEQLANVPRVLRAKKLDELNKEFERQGFPATGGDSDWVSVSTAGQSLQSTVGFLERCGAAAVTVQAEDIPNWIGRNVISLTLKRAVEQNGAEALGLALLEPNDLADSLQQAQFSILNGREPETDEYSTPEFDEAVALDDLVAHGLLTEAEIEQSKRRDPHDSQHDPVYAYDSFGRVQETDNSDFFPSADESDPWRQ
jgi:hypothetical protein